MRRIQIFLPSAALVASVLGACLAAVSLAGCERKERILEIQTTEGSVEVDRNIDSGEVDIEVTDHD